MFTTIDKAIVAAIMGLIFILQTNEILLPAFLTEAWITSLVGIATPIVVYFWPNKKAI
jgi:hypothetical protein